MFDFESATVAVCHTSHFTKTANESFADFLLQSIHPFHGKEMPIFSFREDNPLANYVQVVFEHKNWVEMTQKIAAFFHTTTNNIPRLGFKIDNPDDPQNAPYCFLLFQKVWAFNADDLTPASMIFTGSPVVSIFIFEEGGQLKISYVDKRPKKAQNIGQDLFLAMIQDHDDFWQSQQIVSYLQDFSKTTRPKKLGWTRVQAATFTVKVFDFLEELVRTGTPFVAAHFAEGLFDERETFEKDVFLNYFDIVSQVYGFHDFSSDTEYPIYAEHIIGKKGKFESNLKFDNNFVLKVKSGRGDRIKMETDNHGRKVCQIVYEYEN
jgi:hypothetical protein